MGATESTSDSQKAGNGIVTTKNRCGFQQRVGVGIPLWSPSPQHVTSRQPEAMSFSGTTARRNWCTQLRSHSRRVQHMASTPSRPSVGHTYEAGSRQLRVLSISSIRNRSVSSARTWMFALRLSMICE